MAELQVGDWVKCPGKGKALWVYGRVMSIRPIEYETGTRVWVDRGYLGLGWYSPEELTPAYLPQPPEEVEALREALSKVAGKEAE